MDAAAIREEVAIILRDPKSITKRDLEENGITLIEEPSNIDELRASHAKEYVNKLKAKLRYKPGNFWVDELKTCLGDDFEKHFTTDTATDTQGCSVDERVLLSCLRVMWNLEPEGGFYYQEHYTPLAKDIALNDLVVCHTIKGVTGAYVRDKEYSIIQIKESTNSKITGTWCPSSNFFVAPGEEGLNYKLLHGETDSKGQTEQAAMYQSALLSCHSWKVMNKLFGSENHVLLSSYLSYNTVCSMHIFYRSDNDGFIHQCIFKADRMFQNPPRALEFVRHMCNFAAIAKQFLHNDPRDRWTVKCALMSITPPVETTIPLSNLGFVEANDRDDLYQHQGITYLRKSCYYYVAKRIRNKIELEILKHLKSAPFSLHHNHTVEIEHILHLPNNDALVVMPLHTVVSDLETLSKDWYYQLRFELVEAVAFLHDQNIVHRDIKPDNLIVDLETPFQSSSPHLFVIDFDIAIWHRAQDQLCTGFRGTEGWTAPEVRKSAQWNPRAAEVWAVGKTLKFMAKVTMQHE
ncbi:hypothetical protein FRC03_004658 [Tulasnella sp. 419]|nr:hypothetical protein FRC03_004658 [Tulasnella sp. 419]